MGKFSVVLLVLLCVASLVLAAEKERRYEIPIEGSPAMGPSDAPITIVEFLDYQ
ncbi:MAG: hypothetical protein ACWGN7_02765 [Thermodesulfovibrionales bacterium]